MRGKVVFSSFSLYGRRITPAYAGKSTLARVQALRCRDHPRICGEKVALLLNLPEMRGKETKGMDKDTADRITPAYAGKSIQRCVQLTQRGDHPRICGEKG